MAKGRTNDAKDYEMLTYLAPIVSKQAIKGTGLNMSDIKYLLIANVINDRLGYFTIKQVERVLRTKMNNAIYRRLKQSLVPLEYIEVFAESYFYSRPGKVGKVGTKYRITGKATYLIRKYTDMLRAELANG